jgi:hypothetical protein
MLSLEFAVDGDEDVEVPLGESKQWAVFASAPAGLGDGLDGVSGECNSHAGVNAFV